MGDRRTVFLLIAIMMVVTLVVGGVAIAVLYDAAFEQKRADLEQTVLSQARLMEAVARFDRIYSENYPAGVTSATIAQLRDAHARYKGFGETGEFALARRVGNDIQFVLSHRSHALEKPEPVPFASKLAEPMRRALSGQSGTVVGLDYRGKTVLAAYEPVAILNFGIVAKIDLTEVRAPFLRAGAVVLVIALAIIAAGVALFFRVTNPLVARLRKSEEQFRLITDAIPALISYTDKDRVYRFVNKTYEEWFGIPRSDIIGRHVSEVLGKDDYETVRKHVDKTLFGEPVSFEAEIAPSAKGRRSIQVEMIPDLDDDGTVKGYFVLTVDVTERKRIEEELRQSQKMEAVGQLTGGVAHDFNNLLFVIQGNLELLEHGTTSGSDASANIRAAQDAADRAAELTQRLLAYSRKQPLRPEFIDLSEITINIVRILERTLDASIRIVPRVAKKLPPIHVDPGQLENAILNLALNARDAMPSGGELVLETKVVKVAKPLESLHGAVPAGRHVHLSVRDDGTGMAPEIAAQAFDPFFTTKEVGEGSGLGLSMVHGFVKQSGGFVRLQSEVGVGTSVELYFPPAKGPKKKARGRATERVGGEEAILLVEDDEEVRSVAAAMLTNLGYRVVVAGDGPEALVITKKENSFDLLLTDVMLPGGMSGPQLAEKIRRRHKQIKLLYISGYSGEKIENLKASGADAALLTKPFRHQDLARAVRKALQKG